MEAKIPIPKGWNKRVQSAILHATSLGRHCFVSIVARMANSPKMAQRSGKIMDSLNNGVPKYLLGPPGNFGKSRVILSVSFSG